jgi:hypothetical protein
MTLRGVIGRAIALITYFVISELGGTKSEFNSGCKPLRLHLQAHDWEHI